MNERRNGLLIDAICIISFVLLMALTIASYYDPSRTGYQTNTGIFTAFFCLVPMLFRRMNVMTLPLAFVVAIELAIVLHGYGVLKLQYDNLSWYDSVTHTISSVVVGLCVFYALMTINSADRKVNLGRKGIAMFIVLIMMSFSVYWEVFEIIVDMLAGTNMQYSPFDTMRDMVSNLFGGTLVALYVNVFLKKYPEYNVVESFKLHPKLVKLAAHSGQDR